MIDVLSDQAMDPRDLDTLMGYPVGLNCVPTLPPVYRFAYPTKNRIFRHGPELLEEYLNRQLYILGILACSPFKGAFDFLSFQAKCETLEEYGRRLNVDLPFDPQKFLMLWICAKGYSLFAEH